MSARTSNIKPAIVPTIRYRDVPAMVTWLCDTFGFEKQLIVPDEKGKIALAQLKFGDSLIMVQPVQQSAMDKLMVQPDQVGNTETQICYLSVPDADAHRDRAKAARAEIIFDVEIILNTRGEDFGGRGYLCRDPEGHIWNFGTYDPWRIDKREAEIKLLQEPQVIPSGRSALVSLLAVVAVASSIVAGWAMLTHSYGPIMSVPAPPTQDVAVKNTRELETQLAQQRIVTEASERIAREKEQRLSREIAVKEEAERAARLVENQLAQERAARAQAERLARESTDLLDQERNARAVADRGAREAADRLARENQAKAFAERQAREAIDQIVPERNARAAAELAANELRNELMQLQRAQSMGGSAELREQLAAERAARAAAEQAARLARQQLAQEQGMKQAAEDALRQAQPASPASLNCWTQPVGQCRTP